MVGGGVGEMMEPQMTRKRKDRMRAKKALETGRCINNVFIFLLTLFFLIYIFMRERFFKV